MDISVLDSNRNIVGIIDSFESFIWTERFDKCGDFELVVAPSTDLLDLLQQDRYLTIPDSEYVMVIEKHELTTDSVSGNRFMVSGRSVESLLDRRIIEFFAEMEGSTQGSILWLLNEHVCYPENTWRTIPEIVYTESTDPRVIAPTYVGETTGENLYDVICSLCKMSGLGFKMSLDSNNKFNFTLYMGQDRSYAQDVNPYVVFSPEFDNLINSNYLESNLPLKTLARVGGIGDGYDRWFANIAIGGGAGLLRREIFIDAKDIKYELEPATQTTDPETGDVIEDTPAVTLSDEEYNTLLQERGREKLAEHKAAQSFEGKAENLRMFTYGADYFMGDTIQFKDIYGIEVSAKVVEFVRSYSASGVDLYPSFNVI